MKTLFYLTFIIGSGVAAYKVGKKYWPLIEKFS